VSWRADYRAGGDFDLATFNLGISLGLSWVTRAFGSYLAQLGTGDIARGICAGLGGLCQRICLGVEHGTDTPLRFRSLEHCSCSFFRCKLDNTRGGG